MSSPERDERRLLRECAKALYDALQAPEPEAQGEPYFFCTKCGGGEPKEFLGTHPYCACGYGMVRVVPRTREPNENTPGATEANRPPSSSPKTTEQRDSDRKSDTCQPLAGLPTSSDSGGAPGVLPPNYATTQCRTVDEGTTGDSPRTAEERLLELAHEMSNGNYLLADPYTCEKFLLRAGALHLEAAVDRWETLGRSSKIGLREWLMEQAEALRKA